MPPWELPVRAAQVNPPTLLNQPTSRYSHVFRESLNIEGLIIVAVEGPNKNSYSNPQEQMDSNIQLMNQQ
jgi:hypothetical protein